PSLTSTSELDLASVEPSLAAPKGPQARVALSDAPDAFRQALEDYVPSDGDQPNSHDEAVAESYPASDPPANGAPGHEPLVEKAPQLPPVPSGSATLQRNRVAVPVTVDGQSFELDHGHVVIAAITSCTNTSNPSVMVGAGI